MGSGETNPSWGIGGCVTGSQFRALRHDTVGVAEVASVRTVCLRVDPPPAARDWFAGNRRSRMAVPDFPIIPLDAAPPHFVLE